MGNEGLDQEVLEEASGLANLCKEEENQVW